jgi:hypothetical protein
LEGLRKSVKYLRLTGLWAKIYTMDLPSESVKFSGKHFVDHPFTDFENYMITDVRMRI